MQCDQDMMFGIILLNSIVLRKRKWVNTITMERFISDTKFNDTTILHTSFYKSKEFS